ncbi:hypothetical protein [Elioraea tepidiphila]|jgi:hypothetical protein|uniref:hypothetical protein n=1 Tax=Elioraea tepidiphila TaxID=457934 RepID=UPI00037DF70C|nr:hypothetical protein [Elioraea tepidiphila]
MSTSLFDDDISGLEVAPGRYYGPGSGRDLPIAFRLFGDRVDRFTFCDVNYHKHRTSACGGVPAEWTLISRVTGRDDRQPEKRTWYTADPIQPFSAIEIWRRRDGSEVMVELRRDLAQDVLEQQFAPKSISAFLHINDGGSEGGSNLVFLGSDDGHAGHRDSGERLLPMLATRLCHGAVVVTDGRMADPEFRIGRPFERAGKRWEFIGHIRNSR